MKKAHFPFPGKPCQPDPQIKGKTRRMAKPNYAYAKRQRDLAKKKKKEEKRLRKAEAKASEAPDDQSLPTGDEGTTDATEET